MTTRQLGPAHAEWVAERLTDRDWRIVEGVNTLRLLRGQQIERLFFSDLAAGRSRVASRSRAMQRLVAWRVLVPLPRRIGGAGRGSTALAYALDSCGQRLIRERLLEAGQLPRVRRPGPPTERTVRHILAVSEAFVSLTEAAREHGFTVKQFAAEPASWWPNGQNGYIKPDAYTVLTNGRVSDHWWCELDLATESLPAVKRQLTTYVDFWNGGQLGPGNRDMVPRVVVATTTPERQRAISKLATSLPSAPSEFFLIVQIHELANALYQVLLE
jgi:hypothetical protein